MIRVGEAYRPEVGHERSSTGFLGGASFVATLRRIFGVEGELIGAPVLPIQAGDGQAPRPAATLSPMTAEPMVAPASTDEFGPRNDEIDRLAAHLAGSGRRDRAKRILITHSSTAEAPLAGLDCAAFASQLARSIAHEGRTILVIFGAGGGARPGLSELIDGSASFSEAIHREAGSRLHILPSGHGRAVTGSGLNVVLDALSDTYDFVVLSATDEDRDALRRLSLTLAPRADHVLIGCPGQMGSPDMVALRDALKDEGAGEVIAARIGHMPADAREAA